MSLHNLIKNWIKETLGTEADFTLEYPADMSHGDFAANVALIEAKRQKKNPRELADEYAEKLRAVRIPEVFDVEAAGPGFINFKIDPQVFVNAVAKIVSVGPTFGEESHWNGKRVVVEYAQPNAFKEFHVGHMMNCVIGESISRIIESQGSEIVRATYHSDVGLNVAKAIWGLLNSENDKPLDVAVLGKAYSAGAKIYETNDEVKKEIVEINKKIYDKSDLKINKLYEDGRKISFDYFETIYARLGSNFNEHFYESQAAEPGRELVMEYLERNIFEKSEGAVVFRGENHGLHTRVFLNSDGLPVYEAKELGLMKLKLQKLSPFDLSITITANEQDDYFKVVERVLFEIYPELSGRIKHLSHGMIRLPSGKMSSRTGEVITAMSVIDSIKEDARMKIKSGILSEKQKDEIAESVALAALKFSILRQSIGGNIIFDENQALSFEGDSGPYLQYATVRGKSILKKAMSIMPSPALGNSEDLPRAGLGRFGMIGGWQTTNVERLLERFPTVVALAAREFAPHKIVQYLLDLAGEFNSYYVKEQIISDSDPTSPYKIAMTKAFVDVMTSGLHLLGIKVPEEM